ncbi:zinc finger protein 219-like [Portunus trituberculatus]|uniref:Protein snail n=1 Tax=Portunus trituberculatus TaxID=210409 RepID=A0A5B7G3M2_PORTR|nr:zinc finger protein 219-like [Portunus trituberculatus]MPC51074.1 Protein snail [Portunus trituberculatus]
MRACVRASCSLFSPPSQVAATGIGIGIDPAVGGGAGFRHLRVADAVRRFACPLCHYKTARKDLLEGHVRTHTGDKPFSCPHCPYQSADRSNLRRHRQKSHEGTTNAAHAHQHSSPAHPHWH